jgi:two-component system CheB/CheR fusion protein
MRREEFDVALIDIGLPGLDGYEVARRIRAQKDLDGVLLVALTGYGREEDRQAVREAGFDLHVVKPMKLSDLETILERVKARAVRA